MQKHILDKHSADRYWAPPHKVRLCSTTHGGSSGSAQFISMFDLLDPPQCSRELAGSRVDDAVTLEGIMQCIHLLFDHLTEAQLCE